MMTVIWMVWLGLVATARGFEWGGAAPELVNFENYLWNNESVDIFQGNRSHRDHFKLLREDGMSVLVGARNVIYNISLADLSEHTEERISWPSTLEDRELCLLKGKSEDDCQNYIRVLARIGPDRLLVCGTNSYSPLCRHYQRNGGGEYVVDREFSGKGYAPYDPRHNSTSLFTGGDLYAATVADFSATDSLIIKNQLRTEQYDYKHLNAPNFVSSQQDEDHVYFFFREAAVEYMNCGKSIYSRVARVCKNDQGGNHKFRNRWTTFLKSRLNCSVPGDYPFYFNEIQSTSSFFKSEDGDVFYAVFTTPTNSIQGSAICRFNTRDLEESFEGDFKNQQSVYSNWMAMSPSQVPSPRPGRCYNESLRLPETNLHFIKNHCLMDKPVSSSPASPVFIKTGTERLTRIAVDKDVPALNRQLYDIIYVGTNTGKIIKIVSSASKPNDKTSTVIEEIQVLPSDTPVRNLLIVKPSDSDPKLIVLSDDEVKALPLFNCGGDAKTCSECVAMRSPYCAWDLVNNWCAPHGPHNQTLIQSLELGDDAECPVVPDVVTDTTTTESEHVTEPIVTSTEYIEVEDTTLPMTEDDPTTLPPSDPLNHTISPILPLSCPLCECSCPTTIPPSIPIPPKTHEEVLDDQSSYTYEEISDNRLGVFRQEKELNIQYSFDEVATSTEDITVLEQKSSIQQYSLGTVVWTGIACFVAGIVISLLIGFLCLRVCRFDTTASVTSSNVSLVKPSPIEKPVHVDSGYNTPTSTQQNNSTNNNKNSINMLVNVQPKTATVKSARTMMNCTNTLQKVKRIYL